MDQQLEWNGDYKNEMRTDLFDQFNTTLPFKCCLMLPAATCLCVKEGIKNGKIDENTFIVAIERDGSKLTELEDTLKEIGIKNYKIFHKKLDQLYKTDIAPYTFDLVYLDACGQYTSAIRRVIRDVIFPRCIKNLNFAATFLAAQRHYYVAGEESSCEDEIQKQLVDKVVNQVTPYSTRCTTRTAVNLKEKLYAFVNDVCNSDLDISFSGWCRAYKQDNGKKGAMCTFLFNSKTELHKALSKENSSSIATDKHLFAVKQFKNELLELDERYKEAERKSSEARSACRRNKEKISKLYKDYYEEKIKDLPIALGNQETIALGYR